MLKKSVSFTILFVILVFHAWNMAEAKLPNLTTQTASSKLDEIMKSHASYKELNPTLVKRALQLYIEELDPTKTYFIEPDIHVWLEPSDDLVTQTLTDLKHHNFSVFDQIHKAMIQAIDRRHRLEKQINLAQLPKHVKAEEFKNMKWTANEEELLNRLIRIKALQIETASKLTEENKEKSLQRIAKRQAKYEEEIVSPDPTHREHLILSNVLKAFASSLDAHTAYFTPDEASQFMINVQQRLFGIGAQLRDDINGFTIIKIIEGGPAGLGKELKVKDRIIAVNGEPVVGMDIIDAVELIRGEEKTPVTLTVIRTSTEGDESTEEKLDIVIPRGEVVLKESRYESYAEPYGDGVIAYLKLYSFYQDPESSSTADLAREIKKLKEQYNVKGMVLDLRNNSGGMLAQAVGVTGLFIVKGTVVSIKDETGAIQHLRNLESKTSWDGPLFVLINRGSASASEIVAQTLQDYGRALIVGDDHTFGKGSFQTFTLNTNAKNGAVNPEGEYKVTRGRYYTVSGKTPQLIGVQANIVVPGPLSEMEIGEKFAKYPLENDSILANYDDDLSDIPFSQRDKIRLLYKFDLQPQLHTYEKYLDLLKKNSALRIKNNKAYQEFLKDLKKKDDTAAEVEQQFEEVRTQNDFQLAETYNIMRDLLYLMLGSVGVSK